MKLRNLSYFRILLLVYLLLLILSAIAQIIFQGEDVNQIYEQSEIVQVDDDEIKVSFYRLKNSESSDAFVMLPDLLIGTSILLPLAEELQDFRNVYIFKYPTHDVQGNRIAHSVSQRARVLSEFLSNLPYENVNIASHGYGSLIAIKKLSTSENNKNVKSLSLMSPYGPVEFHLLGSQNVNRYMYNALFPFSFLFRYTVPHFGWYHNQILVNENIRAFAEMDQASFREWTETIELPVHIIHPLNDHYINYQTSVEIHRIIPQSTIATADVNYDKIQINPSFWVDQLSWFWDIVEKEKAEFRADASEDRIDKSKKPFDPDIVESHSGWPLVIMMVFIVLLTFINEDLTCISAGLLAAGGIIDLQFAITACFIGIFITDAFAYFLGSRVGRPIFQKVPFKWIVDENDVDRVENLLKMHGMKVIFATRFLPGTRLPTYITAGMLKTDFKLFLLYFVLAIIVWAPLLVSLAAFLGRPMLGFIETYQDYALIVVAIIILVIYSLLKFMLPLATITGRRRFVVKLLRLRERIIG